MRFRGLLAIALCTVLAVHLPSTPAWSIEESSVDVAETIDDTTGDDVPDPSDESQTDELDPTSIEDAATTVGALPTTWPPACVPLRVTISPSPSSSESPFPSPTAITENLEPQPATTGSIPASTETDQAVESGTLLTTRTGVLTSNAESELEPELASALTQSNSGPTDEPSVFEELAEPLDTTEPEPTAVSSPESTPISTASSSFGPSPTMSDSPSPSPAVSPSPSPIRTLECPIAVDASVEGIPNAVRITWDPSDRAAGEVIIARIAGDTRIVGAEATAGQLTIMGLRNGIEVSLEIAGFSGRGIGPVTTAQAIPISATEGEVAGLVVAFEPGVTPSSGDPDVPGEDRITEVDLITGEQIAEGVHTIDTSAPLSFAEAEELANALQAAPEVAWAEPNVFLDVSALETQTDATAAEKWNLTGPFGVGATSDSNAGKGLTVAVIDTGITDHPALSGKVIDGYDFVSAPQELAAPRVVGGSDASFDADDENTAVFGPAGWDSNPSDPGDWRDSAPSRSSTWHGTQIAGIVSEISPAARIQPVRALSWRGGLMSDIAAAITWSSGGRVDGVAANAQPAKVINLSFSAEAPCSRTLQDAIDGALERGALVVAAAGNAGSDARSFTPANCRGTIAVGATDASGKRAGYSNYGDVVDISAPGGAANDIVVASNAGTKEPVKPEFAGAQGTSLAAAHVTGVAARRITSDLQGKDATAIAEAITGRAGTLAFAGDTCDSDPSITCGAGIVAIANDTWGTPTIVRTDLMSGAVAFVLSGSVGTSTPTQVRLIADPVDQTGNAPNVTRTLAFQGLNKYYSFAGITSVEPDFNFRLSFGNGTSWGTSASTSVLFLGSVPSAPVVSQVTPGTGSATVDFTMSSLSSIAASSPLYQYTLDGGVTVVDFTETASPVRITGLTEGNIYSAQIRAVAVDGRVGPWSSAFTFAPNGIPSAPIIGTPTSSSAGLSVPFTVPSAAEAGGVISNYEYSVDGGSTWEARSPAASTSPLLIPGLSPGTSFDVQLRAINEYGTSAPSATRVVTYQYAPSAPTITGLTAGNRSITVSFIPPADSGGTDITNYKALVSTNGTTFTYATVNAATTSPLTISGLTNGTTYLVRIQAQNAAGIGIASATSEESATPATVPTAPTVASSGSVSLVGDGTATVAFTAPSSNGGSAITNYEWSSNNGVTWNAVSPADTTSPVTLTGLTNGVSTQVRLRAVNVAGGGAQSGLSPAFTPRGAPYAPASVTVAAGNASIAVSFTAPSNNGGFAVTGYQYSIDSGTTWSTATSPFTITGLTNGMTYDVWVRAVNSFGAGTPRIATATPFGTPSAPTELSATPTNGAVSITFTAPPDSGRPITNYEWSADGSTWTAFSPAQTTSPVTISGLTNGTTYSLQLRAINSSGTGTASAATTVTIADRPSAPTNLTATGGVGQVSIDFTAPTSNGGALITNYAWSADAGATWTPLSPADSTSPVVVPGLENGTTYSLQLRAINAAGEGAASSSVSATPLGTPGAPDLQSVTPGDGDVVLRYAAPSTDGGSAITSYQYSLDGGSTWTTFSSGIPSSPIALVGLTNGSQVEVALRAVNAVGAGTRSAVITATPRTTAQAPTSLVATPGNGQVEVSFTGPGSNGGAAITNYEWSVDGSTWTALSPIDSLSPVTVPGLANGTAVQIQLRAVNAAGSGSASVASAAVTPRTVPSAPTSLSATAGDASATITFDAPSADGGASITNYEWSSDSGATWTSLTPADSTSPVTIPGLTNGTSYDIRLRAVNDAGSGTASTAVTVVPRTTPGAPTGLEATPGNASVSVAFTAPVSSGGAAITNYEWSTDGGSTWTALSPADATSPVVVPGLTNGTAYAVSLRAVNAAGAGTGSVSASAVVPRTLPGTPTGVVVTPLNSGLSISFTAPASDGGSAITTYEVSVDSGSTWTDANTSSDAAAIVVSGLANGSSYGVQVRAVNQAGASSASATVAATPRTTPGAPTSLVATPGDGSATVTFTSPASDGGDAIVNYEWSTDGGSNWTAFSPAVTTSPVQITGLTNGTTYIVELRAINAAGSGTASSTVSVTPRRVPTAPTSVGAVPGDGSLTVSFTDPSSDGGNTITNYEWSVDGNTWTALSPADTSSPVTISGLTNGTAYALQLRAVNEAGPGAASVATAATTPRTTPGAPTSLSATPGQGQASIAFTDPASTGGDAISNYEYSIDGGSWTALSPADTSSPVIISGLTNGTAYSVQLRAVNDAGAGTSSSTVSVTPRTTPTSPQSVTVTPGDSRLTVAFAAPVFDGGNAISNYEWSLDGGISWTAITPASTSSPLFITGVTNGTAYSVRVRAVNDAGAGTASPAETATPRTTPDAPALDSVTAADGSVVIAFTAPASDGGDSVSGYEYSLDAGAAWSPFSPGVPTSPVMVTGLSNGTSVQVGVRARNDAGAGEASAILTATPRTTPDAPSSLTTAPGNGQALVSFVAGTDGGAPITNYEWTVDGGSTWTALSPMAGASPVTIPNLTNGTAYLLRIRAVNEAGPGLSSASVSVTPRTTPGAPTSLSATAGAGEAVVAFTPPSSTGGNPISNYEYSTDGGSTWAALLPADDSSPVTISGLTNGIAYSVQLRAVNDAGFGPSSSTVTVTPRTTASAPSSLVATPGDQKLVVAFDDPTSTGGNSISNYEYSIDGGSSWTPLTPADATSPVVIPGLSNGSAYAVQLRAVNDAGAGAASIASSAATPRTTPEAPTSLSVSPGNGLLSVSFAAPSSDGGNAISNYEYSIDGGSWSALTPLSTTSPIVIGGLTNGVSYSIRLRAVNDAGAGTASTPVSATPRTTATAPTALSATPQDGQSIIDFTEPSSTGGSVITNYEYSIDGGTWTPLVPADAISPITIPGLSNGTTYSIRLRAVNDAGSGVASSSVVVTPRRAPTEPTDLVVTPGDRSLEVAFAGPTSDGGSPITNYEWSSDGGNTWTALAPTDATSPVTIPGLTNGNAYSIQLRAVNDAGSGAASSAVAPTTPRTRPGVPTSLSAEPGNRSASISFTTPSSDGGSPITNYEWSSDGGGTWTALSPADASSPITIPNLVNGTPITLALRAVNVAGESAASTSVTTTPRSVPSEPLLTAVTPIDGGARLAFMAPSDTGGSAITRYQYSTDGGSTWENFSTALPASPATVLGLANGWPYSFVMRAVNAAGAGTASSALTATPRTTPDAPTGLVAFAGNQSATVTFTEPMDSGGAPITNYEYSVDDGVNWSALTPTDIVSPVVITGLTNGVTTSVRLRAVNAAGSGAASSAITVRPRTVASAPTNLNVTAANERVLVTFTSPVSNGGATITNYEWSIDGGNTWTELDPVDATSPVRIDGLANGAPVSVQLRAVNAAGSGAASAATTTVIPRTTPEEPTDVRAFPGDGQATVTFTPPLFDGGAPIANYEYSTDAGVTWYALSPADTTSPVVIPGLINGVASRIRLRAVNVAGSGNESTPVAVVTPRTVPGAPAITSITPQSGSLTVAYSLNASNGGSAVSYVQYSLDDGGTWSNFDTPLPASPVIIPGLMNGSSSSVRLRSINGAGASAASNRESGTPRTVPSAPRSIQVIPGDREVTVTFDPPSSDGGASITNYAYSLDDGVTWTTMSPATTSTRLTISGLVNGTPVEVKVRGINAAGVGSEPTTGSRGTPRTAPSAPTGLAIANDVGRVVVAFIEPASTGGSAITNYAWSSDGGLTWTAMSPAVRSGPLTLNGLAPGTYDIAIRAMNAAGMGTSSVVVDATVLEPSPVADTTSSWIVTTDEKTNSRRYWRLLPAVMVDSSSVVVSGNQVTASTLVDQSRAMAMIAVDETSVIFQADQPLATTTSDSSRLAVASGSMVTIIGEGYMPGSQVAVYWIEQPTSMLQTRSGSLTRTSELMHSIEVDSTGRFTAEVPLQVVTGEYLLQVTGWSATEVEKAVTIDLRVGSMAGVPADSTKRSAFFSPKTSTLSRGGRAKLMELIRAVPVDGYNVRVKVSGASAALPTTAANIDLANVRAAKAVTTLQRLGLTNASYSTTIFETVVSGQRRTGPRTTVEITWEAAS